VTRRVAIRVGFADNLLLISLVLAVLTWIFEVALDSFVFRLGPLHERLFPLNDPNEIWMRVEGIGMFLILSVYCQVIITHRKRVEAEHAQSQLREHEARRCCEQAVRVRDHFLAAVSHDLRTPLATIVSRTDLVQGRLGRQQDCPATWLSDQMDAMGEAAHAMLEAVEGITDAARLQMGCELLLRVEAVDLSALVRTIVRTFNEASLWSGAAPLEASIGAGAGGSGAPAACGGKPRQQCREVQPPGHAGAGRGARHGGGSCHRRPRPRRGHRGR
jgi:signal transduction histidine kinase